MPGVMKPLAWSYYAYGVEIGLRRGFHHLGMIGAAQSVFPLASDQRIVASFHGRLTGNVNVARQIFSALPGVTGDDVERDLLGSARDGVTDRHSWGRLPVLLVKLPLAMATGQRHVKSHQHRIRARWRDAVDGDHLRRGSDPLRVASEAIEEFVSTLRLQIWMRVFGQAISAQLANIAHRVDQPHALGALLAGPAQTEEARVADDLFGVATGALTIEQFLADHGYQGPNSGDPSARVWREDRRPIERLLDALADAEPPAERRARAVAERERAVRSILAALPARDRPLASLAIRLAPLAARGIELTKTAMLQSVDIGRAAARDIGERMVTAGVADDIDDVFHLYCDELTGATETTTVDIVAARKELHARLLAEDFPETWQGLPIVSATLERPTLASESIVRGVGASPGVVQGRVRVVRDAADDVTIADGDILVCPTTDPSWVSLMTVSAALVIDLGATASHGAIVARELGVPCVIGTRSGTRQLRDGDLVRVDGSTGIVEVLQRQLATSNTDGNPAK
ncbi:PEP-utilizing enzyme [Mycobacterium sp. Aquia_216]|uniref:PEP-utilizing enzyme n=1 Tax=Mycobacterium sp. Aquia_216 TaxID=2991729 RepID=UPI00227D360B|nr:PEP-utilizing enzyme [Mycobacterium sp. Aquia_216]WAJ45317.1 PEP-utilizing enzyme [Mycobacterium sp. Aquia_216]